ncbi:MAG TPA: histidinol-phosphate transaminase [Smithellaceae bacterium]|nr:histidinol-phosphate transaminase [Smithellaceae bacterium]HRS90312.1 histidinol-phosphate transaminase [Smithellaceae bacterium]HRV27112.1 histidinol-phosphate transaminase [Smithellaceae bacterium]
MIIKNIINKNILRQSGYLAPQETGAVKLDANENPFPLQEPLKKKLLKEMGGVIFNRYPEAGAPMLREKFARYFGVKKDMVLLGNGSDELIQLLCLTLKGKISGVMVPVPTFSMYKIISINTGNKIMEIPLDKDFDLDFDAMRRKIKPTFPALIFLSYPNSPTGNLFNRGKIEALIKKTPGVVVIDEAYADFSGQSLLPLLKKYKNLIFLKTLSKAGLASMRLGFLIGNKEIVAQLDKVRLPYNINCLSQIAADFFLENRQEFRAQSAKIIKNREILYRKMKKINGITPYPSHANFIFFSCAFDSDRIYEKLASAGILVKNLNSGLTRNCMRVTVGTGKENEAFLNNLEKAISELGA